MHATTYTYTYTYIRMPSCTGLHIQVMLLLGHHQEQTHTQTVLPLGSRRWGCGMAAHLLSKELRFLATRMEAKRNRRLLHTVCSPVPSMYTAGVNSALPHSHAHQSVTGVTLLRQTQNILVPSHHRYPLTYCKSAQRPNMVMHGSLSSVYTSCTCLR